MIYRTCSSKKRRCWRRDRLPAEMAVRFYLSKTPTAIRFWVSFMIFLLVETQKSLRPSEVVKLSRRNCQFGADEALWGSSHSQKFLNVSPPCGWNCQWCLDNQYIWTWFVPGPLWLRKPSSRSSAVRKSGDSTAPCLPCWLKCRHKWCPFWPRFNSYCHPQFCGGPINAQNSKWQGYGPVRLTDFGRWEAMFEISYRKFCKCEMSNPGKNRELVYLL